MPWRRCRPSRAECSACARQCLHGPPVARLSSGDKHLLAVACLKLSARPVLRVTRHDTCHLLFACRLVTGSLQTRRTEALCDALLIPLLKNPNQLYIHWHAARQCSSRAAHRMVHCMQAGWGCSWEGARPHRATCPPASTPAWPAGSPAPGARPSHSACPPPAHPHRRAARPCLPCRAHALHRMRAARLWARPLHHSIPASWAQRARSDPG